MKTKIIGEIGINHNGDINIAKKLIDVASIAGCDYVKFQKRNPDVCVPEEQKNKMRETPWGEMTYLEYKHRMEFEHEEYDELFKYAESKKIGIFASVWDKDSVDFMKRYTDIMKVPSALITNQSEELERVTKTITPKRASKRAKVLGHSRLLIVIAVTPFSLSDFSNLF